MVLNRWSTHHCGWSYRSSIKRNYHTDNENWIPNLVGDSINYQLSQPSLAILLLLLIAKRMNQRYATVLFLKKHATILKKKNMQAHINLLLISIISPSKCCYYYFFSFLFLVQVLITISIIIWKGLGYILLFFYDAFLFFE